MREIPDAHCKFQNHVAELYLSSCSKFQTDSCNSPKVIVGTKSYFLTSLHSVTLNFKMVTFKLIEVNSSETFGVIIRQANST